MKRPKVTAILAVSLSLILTACSAGAAGGEAGSSGEKTLESLSSKWVDSDLIGSVTADQEIRLQDDFAAAANREWKLEVGDERFDLLQNISDAVLVKMREAVTDESIAGEEAEVLRKYYGLSSDWDLRNSQGAEPLLPYIKDIESISSTDDLYAFFMDLDRNPMALAPFTINVSTGFHTEEYADVNMTSIEEPKFSLVDEQGKTYYTELTSMIGLEIYEKVESRLLPCIAIYIGGALLITMLVFIKKELDF